MMTIYDKFYISIKGQMNCLKMCDYIQYRFFQYDEVLMSDEGPFNDVYLKDIPAEIKPIIKKIEKEKNTKVYHVIHSYMLNGTEMYSFLTGNPSYLDVSIENYEELATLQIKNHSLTQYLINGDIASMIGAYVYNVDRPEYSEWGSISVHIKPNGLRRAN